MIHVAAMFWTLVLILQSAFSTASILMKEGGTEPVNSNDIAIKFYIQVQNVGATDSKMTLKVDYCCLYQHDRKLNCEMMKGRIMDANLNYVAQPQQLVNFTFLYPTMYPADRQGRCHVEIDDEEGIHKYHFSFNTTLPTIGYIPSFLQNWITGVSNCGSVDEDRLAECHPVNCVLKYHGYYNYFNTTSRLCEPVANCVPDTEEPMPNKVYDSKRNLCKQSDSPITDEEIENLKYKESKHPIYNGYDPMHMEHFVCVQGSERHDGSGCKCYTGWMSMPQAQPSYEPLTQTYYMCNMRTLDYIAKKHPQFSMIALAILAGLNMIMIMSLILVVLGERKASKAVRDRAERVKSSASLRSLPQKKVSSIYTFAKVHTQLRADDGSDIALDRGDIITHLERTDEEDVWQGTCRGVTGTFPSECAEFYSTPPPDQAESTDSDDYEQLWPEKRVH